VVLDEPKGKNNGTVQKKGNDDVIFYLLNEVLPDGTTVRYFSCNDNYGLYVRPGQIESVINDLQPDLARSASNQSIKSQASSTGSIPAPSNSALPKTTALPTKQSGLRAPTPTSTTKPPGIKKI
jgi:dynactin complex subunit